MSDLGRPDITDKEQEVLDFLIDCDKKDIHPTVRSGADRFQTSRFRSHRLTEDQFRGRLESLESKGQVVQYTDDSDPARPKQRYRPAV